MSDNFVNYSNATELMTGIADRIDRVTFTGTTAQWNALTPTAKASYDLICLTDDGGTGLVIDSTPTAGSANPVASGGVYTALTTKANSADLGTAAAKDYTDNVAPNDHNLVESNAVYSAINAALSSVYHVRGDLTCAELTSSLLIAANVGNIYEMSDAGTTSDLFIQGAGETIAIGDNVGIVQTGASTYKFNHMANAFDLHDYQTKALDTPLTIEGTSRATVEAALGGLNNYVNDIAESISNENLISNGWFTVNSRGLSSYTTVGYTVDNWRNWDARLTVTVTNNGITLANTSSSSAQYLTHYLEWGRLATLRGKKLTLSAKLANGTIASATGTVPSGDGDAVVLDSITGLVFRIGIQSGVRWYVDIKVAPSSSYNIRAVKLEIGEISTLADDCVPSYPIELVKCQTATGDDSGSDTFANHVINVGSSNRNLVDNAWFTVNQRRATDYTYPSGTAGLLKTVDRWMINDSAGKASLHIHSNGEVTVTNGREDDNCWFVQIIENPGDYSGKTVTVSIDIVSNTGSSIVSLYLFDQGFRLNGTGILTKTFTVPNNNTQDIFLNLVVGAGNAVRIRAIKVEFGTESTLSTEMKPDYQTELLKCQRYQYVVPVAIGQVISSGVSDGNGCLWFPFSLPTPLKNASGTWSLLSGSLRVHNHGGTYTDMVVGSNYTFYCYNGGNIAHIQASSIATNTAYSLDSATGALILFDANN